MTEALVSKTCTPCRGGIPPLTREQAEVFHAQAPDWQLSEEARRCTIHNASVFVSSDSNIVAACAASARGVDHIRAMKLEPDRAGTGVSGQR